MIIELAFDSDCPHVPAARENLAAALASIGAPPTWTEWRRDDPAAPERARLAGSPAILIDGRDVEDVTTDGAACCRVYRDAEGRRASAPSIDRIIAAIRRAAT